MKKIKSILIALIAMFAISAGAKELPALEQAKFTDNTYVSAQVGYDWNVNQWHGNGVTTGVRIGKMIVPQFGVELEYNMLFEDFYKSLPSGRLGANAVLNLNTLGGYTGKRYVVDVNPFVGIGWQRYYKDKFNGMYTKFGIHLDFNTSKHFSIVLTPSINYNLYPGPMQFDSRRADLNVEAGVKYTFGEFKKSKYNYTQTDIDALQARVNELYEQNMELNAREPQVVTNTIVETQVQTVEIPMFVPLGFKLNTAVLEPTNTLAIKDISEYMLEDVGKFTITGYASVEGPEQYNQNLSYERACAVRDALVQNGVNADNLTIMAGGPTSEFGENYILNRVVLIEVTE